VSRRPVEDSVRGVGVVIPACNEERLLRRSLVALERSLLTVTNPDLRAHVVVVLDSCADASAFIARKWKEQIDRVSDFDVSLIDFAGENVGRARALGCDVLLNTVAANDLARFWIATTDADSHVPAHWLRTQLRERDLGADAWAGRVAVTDWPHHRLASAAAWQRAYDAEVHPIHGANLGVIAEQYVEVGGFPPLRTGEDRALCAALIAHGARIRYDTSAPVITSARRHARAPEGFATALTRFDVRGHQIEYDAVYLRST
jgi:hypothetical protein